jgi:anti-anti-sigma factor
MKESIMEELESNIKVDYGIDKTFITFNDESILEEHKIKKLESAIVPVINEKGDGELILNFCNVQSMSSSVLGLLVKIHKKVCELDGHLKLLNLNPNIYKVFEITQLTKVFDIS